jgi:hypothetical protein
MSRRATRVTPTPMPIAPPVERPLLLDACAADCVDVAGFVSALVVVAIVVCVFVSNNVVAEFGVYALVVVSVGLGAAGVDVTAAWVGVLAGGAVDVT